MFGSDERFSKYSVLKYRCFPEIFYTCLAHIPSLFACNFSFFFSFSYKSMYAPKSKCVFLTVKSTLKTRYNKSTQRTNYIQNSTPTINFYITIRLIIFNIPLATFPFTKKKLVYFKHRKILFSGKEHKLMKIK